MLLEGYIEFENEIPVRKDCLGKKYPIRIAGIPGLLTTPLMFEGFNDERKLGPLLSPEQGNVKYNDHFYWGSVHQWPKGDSAIRACKILFDDIDEPSIEETRNSIALELPRWRGLLIDNISLMLEKDYQGTRRAFTSKSYGLGEFGLFIEDQTTIRMFIPKEFRSQVIEVIVGNTLGFDADGLQQVLDDTQKVKRHYCHSIFYSMQREQNLRKIIASQF